MDMIETNKLTMVLCSKTSMQILNCVLSLYNLKRRSTPSDDIGKESFTFAPSLDCVLTNHKHSRGISNIFKLGFHCGEVKIFRHIRKQNSPIHANVRYS